MESASTSRFRFRNHSQEMGDNHSSEEQTSIDSFSISSDDEESELQSMTAKGVQHLCSELLELKQESELDFQKNLFANYSVFLVILKETQSFQSELLSLKHQASFQAQLVTGFTEEFTLNVLSENTTEPIFEESLHVQSSPSILKIHTEKVSETFDALLIEHRLDDALSLLETEEEFVQDLHSKGKFSSDDLDSYSSIISEKRALLADKFASMAKNTRVSVSELQKALLGLCQLGENHRATCLMFQYYHLRITSGINNFQSSKENLGALYVQKVSQYVCSMISQAGKSYEALNGDMHELIQWAKEEIKSFAIFLSNYIVSLPEISSKLPNAVDSLLTALSYCSLLEIQGMFLKSLLIENLRPCVEEVLRINIDHFSRVISIFTSNDNWVLDRYYVTGILTGTMIDQKQQDYFFLTNSGRKFLTLFQSVAADISTLITIQMESLVLKAITDLVTSYIIILESAITCDAGGIDEGGFRINLPESPTQGISILVNLSMLSRFTSGFIRNLFDGIQNLDKEVDKYSVFVQDVYDRMKSCFVEQFIANIFSSRSPGHGFGSETSISWKRVSRTNDLIPSVTCLKIDFSCQELYLELKKIQKLAEDDVVDTNWLTNLLQQVMESSLEWISTQSEIWAINKEDLADNRTEFMQIILDAQFLVEVARSEGYLSDKSLDTSFDIFSRVEASFASSGISPPSDSKDGDWLANAALEAFHRLQQLHAKESLEDEEVGSTNSEETEQYVPLIDDHGLHDTELITLGKILQIQASFEDSETNIDETTALLETGESTTDLEKHSSSNNRELRENVETLEQ